MLENLSMQVLSIGEILWDIFSDKELLGGAPLNFSANVARLGNSAALITAVGEDDRGRLAREVMRALGVDTQFVQVVDSGATGVAVVSNSPEGEPRFEIPRHAAFDFVDVSPEALEDTKLLKPDWLYFGTLMQMEPHVEQITRQLCLALPGTRCFYDMNLRPGGWNLLLVRRLCEMASILKLNEFEAQTLGELSGMGAETFSLERFCEQWAAQYEIESICVTLGPAGCLVFENGTAQTIPGYPATVQDTVGAGDAFAAAFLHGYHQRWPILQTARFANALGSIVASRAGATPSWSLEECLQLASIPRERVGSEQQ
jgi:fructokinase